MIALIILEALKTVNLILEGIPVEQRQKNYLQFIKIIEQLTQHTDEPTEFIIGIVKAINDLFKGIDNGVVKKTPSSIVPPKTT
jgi:hypothetical protein